MYWGAANTAAHDRAFSRPGVEIDDRPTPLKDDLDRFAEAFDLARREDLSDSASRALSARYDDYADEIERATGQRIDPPRRRVHLRRPAEREAAFERDVRALRERHPDLPHKTRAHLVAEIAEEARQARAEQAVGVDVGWTGLGAFWGSLAAHATDPINVLSMAAGAPGAVRAAGATLAARIGSVARAAAVEGAVGVGAEAMIQPRVFDWKAQIGSPYSAGEAWGNVGMAAAGGALFGGGADIAGQGWVAASRWWRRRRAAVEQGAAADPDGEAAAAVIDEEAAAAPPSPWPDDVPDLLDAAEAGPDWGLAYSEARDEAQRRLVYSAGPDDWLPGSDILDRLDADIRGRVGELVDQVRAGEHRAAGQQKGPPSGIYYGRPSPERRDEIAAALARDLGLKDVDLSTSVRKIDAGGIGHVESRNIAKAFTFGRDDYMRVPDVVITGELMGAARTKKGTPATLYRKRYGEWWVYVVEAVQLGKKERYPRLVFHTGWKHRHGDPNAPKLQGEWSGGGGSTGSMVSPTPDQTSVNEGTFTATKDSLPQPAAQKKRGPLPESLREPGRKPETLLAFLARRGGIRDSADARYGGELAQMGLTGPKPVRPGLVRPDGDDLDSAARAAWEAGFFPEHGDERPDINALLDAIQEELVGSPRHAGDAAAGLAAAIEDVRRQWAMVDRLGIDPYGMTEDQLADALRRALVREAADAQGESLDDAALQAQADGWRDNPALDATDLVEAWTERRALQGDVAPAAAPGPAPEFDDIPWDPYDPLSSPPEPARLAERQAETEAAATDVEAAEVAAVRAELEAADREIQVPAGDAGDAAARAVSAREYLEEAEALESAAEALEFCIGRTS